MPKTGPEADRTPCHCLALRQAARSLSQVYDRHLAEVGLRSTQYSILSKLTRLGPLPIGKLADSMVMERTAMTRTLQPLARDGLLTVGEGQDKRTRKVSLTALGEARYRQAALCWKKAQKEFETRFGTNEAAILHGALDRVVASI